MSNEKGENIREIRLDWHEIYDAQMDVLDYYITIHCFCFGIVEFYHCYLTANAI
jgi:hypothetical protein